MRHTIHCEAVCESDPGTAAWASIIDDPRGYQQGLHGIQEQSSLHAAELTGVIEALRKTPVGARIKLLCASRFIIDGLREHIKTWERKGWKTAKGTPVAHASLWMALRELERQRQVQTQWVKDRRDHPGSLEAFEAAHKQLQSVAA